MNEPTPTALVFDLGQVATYLLVMFGPMNVLPTFIALTAAADHATRRRLAWRAFLIACATGVVAATLGQRALQAWRIKLPALLIAAAVVLFLVAIRGLLGQYAAPTTPPAEAGDPGRAARPAAPPLSAALSPLAFPAIITPYGLAVLILLLAASPEWAYGAGVLAVFLGVMVLDLLAMLFARQRRGAFGDTAVRIVAALLGVLQIALAVQMILGALILLGVLRPFEAAPPR